MKRTVLLAMLVTALLGATIPATVLAAAPGNDNFANATVISAFPTNPSSDISEASTEPGEPQSCFGTPNTVWYAIQPSVDGALTVSSSRFDQNMVIYRQAGAGLAGLTALQCSVFGETLHVRISAGSTYYLQIGSFQGAGGFVSASLDVILPPANDAFANAVSIGSVPSTSRLDTSALTLEPGEPGRCGNELRQGTAWYRFTPSTSGSYTARVDGSSLKEVAWYSGSSVASLTQLGCREFPPTSTVSLQGGVSYYVVVAELGMGSPTTLTVEVAQPPIAMFTPTLSDPSVFDGFNFIDQSGDPALVGISSWRWDFGDGTSSIEQHPFKQFAADGDYTVRLTVTTPDGRTATSSRVTSVRTHDVAITKLSVPTSASAGQTRSITVGLSNHRYPDQVTVTLFRLSQAGPVQIGTSTQSVPIRSGNRTTDFTFSYTFTADDARLGKVSFQAVATVTNFRDVIPGDNQAQSLPTKVNR